MTRFFVSPAALGAGQVRLTGADAHHATRVLRLGPGDGLTLLDGTGRVVEARVTAIEGREVALAVVSEAHEAPDGPPITLVQALPKGDKLDWIVQKATELGVAAIRPVAASRCVVRLDADRSQGKLRRWEAIAREAAEQCERPDLPRIYPPVSLEALGWAPGDTVLVLAERARGGTLAAVLPPAAPTGIWVLVGPEGGWAPEELERLEALGARCVSLGPRILRTETAGLAALAVIQARYDG
ncbi:MAG: 16S rRNA (uracil(1498)-N(3))-methyltransferase [Candidatus Sericytochromatia bacterium]|nr:16S rRNA (uracil(1498)-N(3))-methyltransferase [Candidatus Sericytochromatia bacterium]